MNRTPCSGHEGLSAFMDSICKLLKYKKGRGKGVAPSRIARIVPVSPVPGFPLLAPVALAIAVSLSAIETRILRVMPERAGHQAPATHAIFTM